MIARRRLVLSLLLLPHAAFAQPANQRRRVAFIGWRAAHGSQGLEDEITALARRGYVDGQRIDVVRVFVDLTSQAPQTAQGLDFLVPRLEQEVRRARPDVLVSTNSIMGAGLQRVTRTIPIVTAAADPVAMGLAASIARPGGNITGVSYGLVETALKTMEFMKVLLPGLRRLAIFHDVRHVALRAAAAYEQAARQAGIEPLMRGSLETAELVRALREAHSKGVEAGLMAWAPPEGDAPFFREAVALRMPLAGAHESAADQGALVSYTSFDPVPMAERIAALVELVLKGADPGTIPFIYPQAFRLVVNKRTANALGFKVPAELLLRADRVIESA